MGETLAPSISIFTWLDSRLQENESFRSRREQQTVVLPCIPEIRLATAKLIDSHVSRFSPVLCELNDRLGTKKRQGGENFSENLEIRVIRAIGYVDFVYVQINPRIHAVLRLFNIYQESYDLLLPKRNPPQFLVSEPAEKFYFDSRLASLAYRRLISHKFWA